MPKRAAAPEHIYQLKITLCDTKPPIWRRVEVADTMTLAKLHEVVQVAMGWYDSHLHMFTFDGVAYGVPDMDDWMEVRDERRVKLNQLLSKPKQKLRYQYDFGDSWEHEILLEKILDPDESAKYPRCTAGKLACPPEDCGGVWGYESFLEAIADPQHPEHAEMLEWVGGEFDPLAFDSETVTRMLQGHYPPG